MGFSDLKRALKSVENHMKSRTNNDNNTQLNQNTIPADSPPPIPDRNYGNHQNIFTNPVPNTSQNTSQKISQNTTKKDSSDLFNTPISTNTVSSTFPSFQHSQKPRGCTVNDGPIQTNNFYNNLTLEDQTFPIWTLPYSLWLTKDPDQDVGFAFNHTEALQRVYGPDPAANPVQFYFNPPKIKSFVLSAEGFLDNVALDLSNHDKLSVTATLSSNGRAFTVPLAQGMGFITALYHNSKPIIALQVGVQEFNQCSQGGKYRVKLFNQVVWTIYCSGVELRLADPNHIVGNSSGDSIIQICRGECQAYDEAAGAYPTKVTLNGSVNGTRGTYSFTYELQGQSKSGKTVVWALPHHQEVINTDVTGHDIGFSLDSTTKGVMKGYLTTELSMEESLMPIDIEFAPWSQLDSFSKEKPISEDALKRIRAAAEQEIKQDVVGMANIDSMYTSGKILDKFAHILYVLHYILQDQSLVNQLLPKIKEAINIFASNKQKYPLVYDQVWKGLISSADPGADFGNSNYNDHHFHYGYHIHAVGLVAKVDPDFLQENNGLVKEYITLLIRDTANPVNDGIFPQSRSFDWFHGHSFAHGIFALGDGKDEESSSEDYHFAYGLKLYGMVTGDSSIEARANLMLAIMKRSMNMYMLYLDDNKVQPPQFIKNKVAGITFENKIDFSTYFGRGTIADEWIHGIHMLPITPISSYIRGPTFVREEWDQKLLGIIDQIPDGWKGILMLNSALFDPERAWKWFTRDDWNDAQIDNGMSRTWSLAYIAKVGGK